MRSLHVPVLLAEVLEGLAIKPGMTVVDVTAGAGGHLAALADAVGEGGRVIAFDRDPRAHKDEAAGGVAKARDNVVLVQAPFSELERVLEEQGVDGVDGLLADLGVSSMQLDESERGFSFGQDGPLDMRMGPDAEETAAEMIVRLSESDLADVIFHYGEERKSRRVARAIKRELPIETTAKLAEVVARAMGGRRGKIHPATRTFQGIRIAVNRELDELDALIDAIPRVLKPGGRAAVISFHSLEDRRVKHGFRDEARGDDPRLTVLTKRPITASDDEIRANPRSRSAKLRVVERREVQG